MANNHTFKLSNDCFAYFGGLSNTQWIAAENKQYEEFEDLSNPANHANLRYGVRDGFFVRDTELFQYGFSYPEGIGWINVWKIST